MLSTQKRHFQWLDKHVKEEWMWIYWEGHFQYSVCEMRISLWCSTAHPHLLIFLTYRGHTMKCFTILNAFQTTLLQRVGQTAFWAKRMNFPQNTSRKPACLCAHIQAMPQWSIRGSNLQCYRLCLVCSRGEAWQQRREILSYRSLLCSSNKIATFWRKKFIWKEFAAWRENQNWYVGQSAFYTNLTGPILYEESRGKEIDRFLKPAGKNIMDSRMD